MIDLPPPDPKTVKTKEDVLKFLAEASRKVGFRTFRLKKCWEEKPYSELRWMRNWLVTVLGLAKLVDEIWVRHTPERWEWYRKMGIKNLAEQKELNRRIQHLQIYLNKNKPPCIVKAKPSETAKVTYTDNVTSIADMGE